MPVEDPARFAAALREVLQSKGIESGRGPVCPRERSSAVTGRKVFAPAFSDRPCLACWPCIAPRRCKEI